MEKGTRVVAIQSVKNGVVKSFGEGVYEGDHILPKEIFGVEFPNPKITLDTGKVVWGFQCWWGEIDAMRKRFPETYTWELVDLTEVTETP